MTEHFDAITILYNPNSTGSGKQHALELWEALQERGLKASVTPTEYAGHAEKLAYNLSKACKRPLIISASGDGGYHEVINGALRAQLEGAHPVTSLLPSGNANDHHSALTQEKPIADLIAEGCIRSIDALSLRVTKDATSWERFAHSYIGLGITAQAGSELNKVQLNVFNQVWIVLRSLFNIRPVYVVEDGRTKTYKSIVFSNINRMSKVFSMHDDCAVDDGEFEIAKVPDKGWLGFFRFMLKALHKGSNVAHLQAMHYEVMVARPCNVQLDGEVRHIAADSTIQVGIRARTLRCII